MSITMIPISKLENNKGQIAGVNQNPRELSTEQFNKTVESIKSFPEMLEVRMLVVVPIADSNKYIVVGGNQRYRALKELNYKEAPCVIVNWTPEKINEFIIKDNLSYGEWDWDLIANEWEQPRLQEWGLEIPFADVDYSVLDEEDDGVDDQMDGMADEVKKAIQIEFNVDDFEHAKELVKFFRDKGQYIGGILIQALRETKKDIE